MKLSQSKKKLVIVTAVVLSTSFLLGVSSALAQSNNAILAESFQIGPIVKAVGLFIEKLNQ